MALFLGWRVLYKAMYSKSISKCGGFLDEEVKDTARLAGLESCRISETGPDAIREDLPVPGRRLKPKQLRKRRVSPINF